MDTAMERTFSDVEPLEATDDHVLWSFRDMGRWLNVGGPALLWVMLGDPTTGPLFGFSHFPPGVHFSGPAHCHASDTFKISLKGEFSIGRKRFGPGEFRVQPGWKVYPSEGLVSGPDGGWELIFSGDRRGLRVRFAKELLPGSEEDEREWAHRRATSAYLRDVGGDLLSDDPADGCGPSTLTTTSRDVAERGNLDGSFARHGSWPSVTPRTRALVSLMGDRTTGPVHVLAVTEAGGTASPACRLDTEVLRLVIDGSCEIDGRTYSTGDIRVQRAGRRCGPVVAGPDGLHELVVIGDRRALDEVTDDTSWWLGDDARRLVAALASAGERPARRAVATAAP